MNATYYRPDARSDETIHGESADDINRSGVRTKLASDLARVYAPGLIPEDVWDVEALTEDVFELARGYYDRFGWGFTVAGIDQADWADLTAEHATRPEVVCDECSPLAVGGYVPCPRHR